MFLLIHAVSLFGSLVLLLFGRLLGHAGCHAVVLLCSICMMM